MNDFKAASAKVVGCGYVRDWESNRRNKRRSRRTARHVLIARAAKEMRRGAADLARLLK